MAASGWITLHIVLFGAWVMGGVGAFYRHAFGQERGALPAVSAVNAQRSRLPFANVAARVLRSDAAGRP